MSRPIAALAVLACVVGLVQGVAFVSAPRTAPAAAAAASGTGGEFVPLHDRILDTRLTSQVGPYSTPMPAGLWRTVPVEGVANVPASGVSAVTVTFTVVNPAVGGLLHADKDESTPNSTVTYMTYTAGDTQSNTGTLAVTGDGKIQVYSTQRVDLVIDVQGYYTADDSVAPGGYVPVTPKRLVDTRSGVGLPKAPLPGGSTSTIAVTGKASVPAGASAVMVNITIADDTATGNHVFVPYPADEARPAISYQFNPQVSDSNGTQVGLSSSGSTPGAFKFYLSGGSGYTVDLVVDVVGYFTAGQTTGAFTPATARVYDSRTTGRTALAAGSTRKIQVTGVAGIPLAGSGLSSVVTNLQVIDHAGHNGWMEMWANGATRPDPYSSVNYFGDGVSSNMATSALASNGAVSVYNNGPDSADFVIDVEGWYSNTGAAISNGQTNTQQSITLQAQPTGSGSWVTYKYRTGTTTGFTTVPTVYVTDGNGNHPSWPIQKSSGAFPSYSWNIHDTLAAVPANNGIAPDSLVQVEACYGTSGTDANPACGMPSNVNFARSAFGDAFATEPVGPGTLADVTGDYEISATDADATSSLSDLSIGRTLTTLAPAGSNTGADGIFGPGWSADLDGPASGEADLHPVDHAADGYLLFTGSDGSESTYQATSDLSTYPISFTGSGDNAGDGETVTKADARTITMTDPDGTVTSWTGSGNSWQVQSVDEPGSNSTTTYSYNSAGLVTRILAPVPDGVSCANPDTTPGCRSLTLDYEPLTVSGSSVTRLQDVQLSIPQTAGTANTITVAAYEYDTAGRLADAYDPRISPALKTAYTYTAANRLATLTPPGQAPWSFAYNSDGSLSTISRPDPSGTTATTTIVYRLPLSGTGLPNLTQSQTAGWGETSDLPVDESATAIFPPSRQPAGTAVGTVTATDWPYATIAYLDVDGQQVNTAAYSAGDWQIDTSQYDGNGNAIWDLSAGNRAQALTPTGDTDGYVAGLTSGADRAALLASTTSYNPLDPGEVTDTYGPAHAVTLDNGTVIDARTHVATTYDAGAPNGDVNAATGATYDLPTSVTTSADNLATGTDQASQTVHYGYDPIDGSSATGDTSGWTLSAPTTSTDPGGLITYTRYDANGRVIEQRLPGDANGTGPRTTLTTYYTATGTGPCVDPTRSGLVCQSTPAAQPSTGDPLPVSSYRYNQYGDPTAKIESYGTGTDQVVRTTSTEYDAGERQISSAVTVDPAAAGGTPVRAVAYDYDPTTGFPTTSSTGTGSDAQTLSTGYNSVGEPISYTDASGTVSHTSYDLDGRVVSVDDGKGTTSYTYDEQSGQLTSEDIGVSGSPSTFTATYDPAGDLATQIYPNGLVATRRYDNAGDLTGLDYAKGGTTWLHFSQAFNAQGQIASQSSAVSNQVFGYDGPGRLTTVQDTLDGATGNTCTTRQYVFNDRSDRTSLASYPAAGDGSCTTSSTPTTTSYSYDDADRLTSDTAGSYSYDQLGRTTLVPAGDAAGIGSHASTTGDLTVGYYANDMVASQTQGAATVSFTLDPDQNRILSSTDGSATTVNHYSDDSDSPTWTETGSDWSRNITGIDGGLAAISTQTGTVTLQLANPHGDIVATATDDPAATGVTSYSETTEYGTPRDPASANDTYGWLGTKQRSTDDIAGLTLMGVRLYNPATGRFLSVDPLPGGNANAYIYPDDPINEFDLNGQWCMFGHNSHGGCRGGSVVHAIGRGLNWAAHLAVRAKTWVEHHKAEFAMYVLGVAIASFGIVLTGGLSAVMVSAYFEAASWGGADAALGVAEVVMKGGVVVSVGLATTGAGVSVVWATAHKRHSSPSRRGRAE